MKRMRFFAVIFTLLIGIVSSNFSMSERVLAAYTLPAPQQYAPYLSASTDLANTFYDAGFQSSYSSAQKTLYAQYFQSLKGIMMTKAQELASGGNSDESFQVNVLNDFKTYLKSVGGSITDPLLFKVNADTFALAESAHTNSSMTDAALAATGGTAESGQSVSQLQSAAQENLKKTQKTGAPTPSKCITFTSFDLGGCIDAFFAWIITHTLLALAGWLLWLTATIMNYAINVGILQFASWAPDTLYPIWLVVRQITSLFVVFAGLWLGFMYIIDKGKEFEKYIPTVIIFALFINFSYPLTRTVIDISNIISLNIYASTVGASTLEASTVSVGSDKTAGTLIMNKLGLVGIVDYATGDGKTDSGSLNSINSVGPALLAVLFILYAAWIFFVISTLLVTRTAVLVFLIICSPLLFVDRIIPKLGEKATELRGIFWEMLFVGPVFTIMLALTLKFLEVFKTGKLSADGNISAIAGSGDSAIPMFFNMIMMLIMLHIMYKVTKATSGKIGQAVAGATGMAGGMLLGGPMFGGVAAAGRLGLGGVGRMAQKAGTNAAGTGWMQKDNVLSRKAFQLAGSVAEGSYDARNTSFVKWGGSKLGMGAMGTPSTKGYTERKNEKEKEDRTRRNFARSSADVKEQRIKDDYNAITDTEGRKSFLTNLEKTNSTLYKKITEEERKKALATYKGFEDNEQGRKEKFDFYKKQDPETRKRLDEFETKTEMDKDEKRMARQDSKDATQAMKDLTAAMNPKNNQRMGGEDPSKGSSGLGSESSANHTAQVKYIAPVPQAEVPLLTYTKPTPKPGNESPDAASGVANTPTSPNGGGSAGQGAHALESFPS